MHVLIMFIYHGWHLGIFYFRICYKIILFLKANFILIGYLMKLNMFP